MVQRGPETNDLVIGNREELLVWRRHHQVQNFFRRVEGRYDIQAHLTFWAVEGLSACGGEHQSAFLEFYVKGCDTGGKGGHSADIGHDFQLVQVKFGELPLDDQAILPTRVNTALGDEVSHCAWVCPVIFALFLLLPQP